jgi:hypothetical protein
MMHLAVRTEAAISLCLSMGYGVSFSLLPVVLMVGNGGHVWRIKEKLIERNPSLLILVSTANEGNRTYDGVEIGGYRLAQEVRESSFSFMPTDFRSQHSWMVCRHKASRCRKSSLLWDIH